MPDAPSVGRKTAFPGKTARKTVSLTETAVALVTALRILDDHRQSDSDVVERAIRAYAKMRRLTA